MLKVQQVRLGVSQSYILLKAGRITEEEYQKLDTKLEIVSKEIKGFMKYLQDFENRKKSTPQKP